MGTMRRTGLHCSPPNPQEEFLPDPLTLPVLVMGILSGTINCKSMHLPLDSADIHFGCCCACCLGPTAAPPPPTWPPEATADSNRLEMEFERWSGAICCCCDRLETGPHSLLVVQLIVIVCCWGQFFS
jgi:hypothetical protein